MERGGDMERGGYREGDRLRHNRAYFRGMLGLLTLVEAFMVLVYYISQTPGKPTLDRGYCLFYCVAIASSAVLLGAHRLLRSRPRAAAALEAGGVGIMFLWACCFSIYDVLHGNSGTALPQVMLFTAAGMRFPRWLHWGMDGAAWLLYLLLLGLAPLDPRTFYSEAINSGIYFFIACAVIAVAYRFQAAQTRAVEKILQLQQDNLDTLSAYMDAVRSAEEESRIIRHDLRHIALAVGATWSSGTTPPWRRSPGACWSGWTGPGPRRRRSGPRGSRRSTRP